MEVIVVITTNVIYIIYLRGLFEVAFTASFKSQISSFIIASKTRWKCRLHSTCYDVNKGILNKIDETTDAYSQVYVLVIQRSAIFSTVWAELPVVFIDV